MMMDPASDLPSYLETRCAVVNSRVLLVGPEALDGRIYHFTGCSNIDNCYNRPDFQGQIPDCLLHVRHEE